ncbi:MAG: DUF488 domain-containing protein [Caldilineales bacterium]|nr:DUF488 domain-containing protein [Caldilineales bacterium]MDW8316696.1 DUF488 domain-containing protein [Anaerolineae bacterium]
MAEPAAVAIVTIGVYGWTEPEFLAALAAAEVDTLVDVRARRGVRGAAYAFANSQRLQAGLAAAGIRYLHRGDLAPSRALRAQQAVADKEQRTAKRQRHALSPEFVVGYWQERLAALDSRRFLAELGPDARVVALFCVEREPAACHRSLLAQRLADELGVAVQHLTPP